MTAVSTVLVVVAVIIVVGLVVFWYVKRTYAREIGLLEFFANPLEAIRGLF